MFCLRLDLRSASVCQKGFDLLSRRGSLVGVALNFAERGAGDDESGVDGVGGELAILGDGAAGAASAWLEAAISAAIGARVTGDVDEACGTASV